jgi:hypothetical protein
MASATLQSKRGRTTTEAASTVTSSPTESARSALRKATSSLATSMKGFVEQPFDEFISSFSQLDHRRNLLGRMEQNPTKIPASARFNFTLKGTTELSKTQEMRELILATNDLVTKLQLQLRDKIVEAQTLETKLAQRNCIITLINAVLKCFICLNIDAGTEIWSKQDQGDFLYFIFSLDTVYPHFKISSDFDTDFNRYWCDR